MPISKRSNIKFSDLNGLIGQPNTSQISISTLTGNVVTAGYSSTWPLNSETPLSNYFDSFDKQTQSEYYPYNSNYGSSQIGSEIAISRDNTVVGVVGYGRPTANLEHTYNGIAVHFSTRGTQTSVGVGGETYYQWNYQSTIYLPQRQTHYSNLTTPINSVSLAIDGTGLVVVVGMRYDSSDLSTTTRTGTVYVYTRPNTSSTSWTLAQTIPAPATAITTISGGYGPDIRFGWMVRVSYDGNTIVASAPNENVGQGAAFVYVRSGGTWNYVQKLSPTPPAGGATSIGLTLDISDSGNTIAVSTPTYRTTTSSAYHGATYIFEKSGSTWALQQTLAHDPAEYTTLGTSARNFGQNGTVLDSSGNSLFVGGSTYVSPNYQFIMAPWTRTGNTWSFNTDPYRAVAYISFQDSGVGGVKLSCSGDGSRVVAGFAYMYDSAGTIPYRGVAWHFDTTMGTFAVTGTARNEYYGAGAVILRDGTGVFVGSSDNNRVPQTPTDPGGAVTYYSYDGGFGTTNQRSFSQPPSNTHSYGTSATVIDMAMDVTGKHVVVATPYWSGGSSNTSGSTADLTGAIDVLEKTPNGKYTRIARMTGTDTGDPTPSFFGTSTAVNGDATTIAVRYATSGAGKIAVITRSGSTLSIQGKLALSSLTPPQYYNTPIQAGYDALRLSKDGNLLVCGISGTYYSPPGGAVYQLGLVAVYRRTGSTWAFQQWLTPYTWSYTNYYSPNYGRSIAISGDGNTIAVGAPGDNEGRGAAYTYTWNGSSWVASTIIRPSATLAVGSYFGYSISLDSTGTTLAIGMYDYSTYIGGAYVYTRANSSTTTWTQQGSRLTGTGYNLSVYGPYSSTLGQPNQGIDVQLSEDGLRLFVVGSQDIGPTNPIPFSLYNAQTMQMGSVWMFDRSSKSSSTWIQQGGKFYLPPHPTTTSPQLAKISITGNGNQLITYEGYAYSQAQRVASVGKYTEGAFVNYGAAVGANTYALTISANTTDIDLYSYALSHGWNGIDILNINIANNVYVTSSSTSTAAMTVAGNFPNGVTLTNSGYIVGRGGDGGNGATYAQSGFNGSNGGTGLNVSSALTLQNGGTIAGGGGGGGGGASAKIFSSTHGGSGGGGGAGFGAGGAAGSGTYPGYAGASGTATAGGAGGPIYAFEIGGGNGGGLGSAGSAGGAFGVNPGGSGGAGGYSIIGYNKCTIVPSGGQLLGSTSP